MNPPLFHKIAILGPGLLGGSLLLAIRERGLATDVAIWGRNPASLEEIRQAGIDCTLHHSVEEAVKRADLVVLCVPIGAMTSVVAQCLPSLSPEGVVTDVGSVKAGVVRELDPLLQGRAHWIGSHPMAGRELSGFSAAKPDLFQGATTILTPTPLTTLQGRQKATVFWQAVGARVLELDPETHDQLVAEISHLPHLVAAALTQCASPDSLPLVGTGFRDTTRVASGPAEMWQEILLTNRAALGASLDHLIELLQQTRVALAEGNGTRIRKLLTSANELRQLIVKS